MCVGSEMEFFVGDKVRLEFEHIYVASGTVYKAGHSLIVFGVPLGSTKIAVMVDKVVDGAVPLQVPPNKFGML